MGEVIYLDGEMDLTFAKVVANRFINDKFTAPHHKAAMAAARDGDNPIQDIELCLLRCLAETMQETKAMKQEIDRLGL